MARMSVRQMWKAKLEGRLPSPVRQVVSDGLRRPFAGRVLGIDPSLRGTGLALIEFGPGGRRCSSGRERCASRPGFRWPRLWRKFTGQ